MGSRETLIITTFKGTDSINVGIVQELLLWMRRAPADEIQLIVMLLLLGL